MSSKKNSNKNQNKNSNNNKTFIKKRKYQTITTQGYFNDESLSSLCNPGGSFSTILVKNSSTQGVRKAKNFTLQISSNYNFTSPPYIHDQKYGTGPISFALVYCPCNQSSLNLQSPNSTQNLLYPINLMKFNFLILSIYLSIVSSYLAFILKVPNECSNGLDDRRFIETFSI